MKRDRKHKLGKLKLAAMNARLNRIRLSYPKEFHRIPKDITKVNSMIAVELRHLLLYTGPYIFSGMLL